MGDTYAIAVGSVPLVAADVCAGAIAGSLAASLRALATSADRLFDIVDARLSSERARLAVLQSRIAAARARVGAMSGSTKAITVYASPRYPAAEVARLSAHAALWAGVEAGSGAPARQPPLSEVSDDALSPVGVSPSTRAGLAADDEVLARSDKAQALLALLGRAALRAAPAAGARAAAPPPAGLGPLPARTTAVVSALRWNSRESAYAGRATLADVITDEDTEAAVALLRRQAAGLLTDKQRRAAEEEARRLGVAPSSLMAQGDALPAFAQVEYTYRPRMKDLGAFELPSHLALPNVADISLQVRTRARRLASLFCSWSAVEAFVPSRFLTAPLPRPPSPCPLACAG